MGARANRWLLRHAMEDTGAVAVFAARRLAHAFLRSDFWNADAAAERILQVWLEASAPEAADAAAEALERGWADDYRRRRVWGAIRRRSFGGKFESQAPYEIRDLPYQTVQFLLAAMPSGVPRLAELIAADSDAADVVVAAALDAPDPRVRDALSRLVRASGDPAVLRAIEAAIEAAAHALDNKRLSLRAGYRLWEAGNPAPLLQLAMDNPHLPRAPADRHDGRVPGAVLAVLLERLDLLEHYVGFYLLRKLTAMLPLPLPTDVTATIRRALREVAALEDAVCYAAVSVGAVDPEVDAAFRDGGARWSDPRRRAVYLYFTEQWKAYDRHDRGRGLINQYIHDEHWNVDTQRMRALAKRAHRRDPFALPKSASRYTRPDLPAGIRGSDFGGHFGGTF